MRSNKGFTLIELLLYISISAVMLLAVSVFLSTLLQSRVKNQTIAEVEQQGVQVMQIITQTIRNAEGINSPAKGTSAASLSVDIFNSADDPTVFDLSSGTIRIAEGAGSPLSITNSRIVVSGLNFQNLSRDNTSGIIRAQFTITHVNPENRNEYYYNKTFYASASLRGGLQGAALTQADSLIVNTSGANIGGGGNKELRGITVENTSASNSAIDKITLTWTNSQLIEEIKIEGTRVWKHNNEGSPDGKQVSGTELDIVDYIIGSSTDTIGKFKFDGNMTGATFSITFEMEDGSTKSVSGLSP